MEFHRWPSWPAAEAALRNQLPAQDVQALSGAYEFAADAHADQVRPAGEPYTSHLLEVLEILTAVDADTPVLAAGLLHDVVEDTPCSLDEVRERFGARVAGLVGGGVTIPEPDHTEDAHHVRERYLRQLASVPTTALTIKLADRYSNVQRLHTHPRIANQRTYYRETVEHVLPLASNDPFFGPLFADWAAAYAYLRDDAVDNMAAAELLAAVAHRGQRDKSGAPYIGHPRAVARIVEERGGDADQQLAALLHDVVEDTPIALAQVVELGVPDAVVSLVDALTHRRGESQVDYLHRLAQTPGADLVKRADITHNSSPNRLALLDPGTQARLRRKYAEATATLDQLGSSSHLDY